MLRRFLAGTKAALSPTAIREAMAEGQRMGEVQSSVMPNGREISERRRPPDREGPIDWAQAAGERAHGRSRFASPSARPARIDRFTVPGTDPTAGVRALSWAGVPSRSHEVWGCYPSAAVAHPGHLVDGRLGVKAGAAGPIDLPWVEWTVVHAAGPELATALAEAAAVVATASHGPPPDVEHVTLDRAETWLRRPKTDPVPFDEDVAALLCHAGRVDPAASLGVHRVLSWGVWGPAEQRHVMVEPTGVGLLGRPEARLGEARSALARSAPTRFEADDDLSVHVAALDLSLRYQLEPWPWTQDPPTATAYPWLPGDTDELLLAYLEIVGLHPQDCYGVATTIREQQSGRVLPGDAVRGDAAGLVTVVHRDDDDYEAGRRRFAEWCQLEVGCQLVDEREPVEAFVRWGVRAMKLKNIDTMGLGTYREHKVGQSMDVDFYPYCAGPRPRA